MGTSPGIANTQIPNEADVVIVGAGLAGLSCASELVRRGRSATLLEASDGVGGRVRSDRVDGFVLDRGFQVLLTAYPEVQQQLDLDALQLHAFRPGALVRHDGGFHRVSDPMRRPQDALATLRAPAGTLADKLRVGLLRLRLMRADPRDLLRQPEMTTLRRLRELHFSEDMIERFFRPFFGGVALDPHLATSSRMFDVYFRCFAAGDAALPEAGMQAIPDQLAAKLPTGSIHLGARVARVEPHAVHLADGTSVRANAVVVATDGHVAAQLTSVRAPRFCASTTVWFAADAAPIDEPVIVVSGARSDPAQSMAVVSAAAPSYAPPGAALIGASAAGRTGVDLVEAIRDQFRRWFGRSVDSWRHLRTDDIPHALPDQSPPFHPKRRVRLDNGVYVCGDHRDTGSVQGAMYSGRRTAALVADEVAASVAPSLPVT